MLRGELHFLSVPLPNRDEVGGEDVWLDHYALTLRGTPGEDEEPNVPFVVGTSNRRKYDFRNSYEAHFDGPPFHHPTYFDCRWVMTLPAWHFTDGTYRATLDRFSMWAIDAAIAIGLQLGS